LTILVRDDCSGQQRFSSIVHIVHEYANFVSSSEMVLSGRDVDGVPFKPPINTHVSHAFTWIAESLLICFRIRLALKGWHHRLNITCLDSALLCRSLLIGANR